MLEKMQQKQPSVRQKMQRAAHILLVLELAAALQDQARLLVAQLALLLEQLMVEKVVAGVAVTQEREAGS
jgi:hypothetical protein